MSTIGSKLDPKKPAHAASFGRDAAIPKDNAEAAIRYVYDTLNTAIVALTASLADTEYDANTARNLAVILQGVASTIKADVHRMDGQIVLRAQVFN